MKIGILGGTFNPIHIGHLALANWLCEYENLDEILFLVTPQNPLKQGRQMIDYQARFAMVEAAIADYPRFRASDFERRMPQPNYTVNTLRALRSEYPDRLFHLIIGADNWAIMEQWKDFEALIAEFPILIYPRLGYETSIPAEMKNVRKVDAPIIEISSSFIRKAIGEGRDVRFFLPEAIRHTISKISEF